MLLLQSFFALAHLAAQKVHRTAKFGGGTAKSAKNCLVRNECDLSMIQR
jgi:hypothetical protein